jgi:hypothetical protein
LFKVYLIKYNNTLKYFIDKINLEREVLFILKYIEIIFFFIFLNIFNIRHLRTIKKKSIKIVYLLNVQAQVGRTMPLKKNALFYIRKTNSISIK